MPGSDFNGDGRDDMLWRNTQTGYSSNWLGTASGGFLVNDAVALDPWTPGNFAAIGDFNGDGRADTLWRNDGNEVFLSITDPGGAFYFQWNAGFVARVAEIWQIAGAGDFNGDGRDDILWRNEDGRMSNWLSNSSGSFTVNDANAMTSIFTSAVTVEGIGDFNGDGRDDIVTRHTNGTLELSFSAMNGGFGPDDPFAQVSADWQLVGVGDFNGNGNADLLWRNMSNGQLTNWLYAGGLGSQTFTVNNVNALAQVTLDWEVSGTGDFNGDGRDDILWRHVNGTLSNWLATPAGGWIINDANALAVVPTNQNWVVEPFKDTGFGVWDY